MRSLKEESEGREAEERGGGAHSLPSSCIMSPITLLGRQTDEAGSSQ